MLDARHDRVLGRGVAGPRPGTANLPGADNDHHLSMGATPLPNAGREKAEAAARSVGGRVLLPDPMAGRVAAGKGTDWNDYEGSQGQAAMREALRMAGLVEVRTEAVRPAAARRAAERQGSGMTV